MKKILASLSLMTFGLLFIANFAYAGLCVWRFPDRDIKEIYDADSYKTVFVDVTPAKKEIIEKKLGAVLDPDEGQFKFWPVYKQGIRVGTVTTHLTKGNYGAIEVVIALSHDRQGNNPRVREVRIQRDREKARMALRSPEFLNQFIGKTTRDPLEVDKDIKPVSEAVKSSQSIAFSVKKQLVAFEELMAGRE